MNIKGNYYLKLILLTFLSSLIFWLIFYFNLPRFIGFPETTLETIYTNYDGPNYIVISKCGYNKECISQNFSLPLPLEYYPAHFPGYPLIISLFSFFTTGTKSMLLATLSGSIFLTIFAFKFFKLFIKEEKAYFLALLLLVFPARLFVLRQIGAPETWFIGSILASVYFFKTKKYIFSAIFAALSQFIKSPGALLAISYLILALFELKNKFSFKRILSKYYVFLLIPLSVILIFLYYQAQTGNFLAYFQSGDNHHLYSLPYMVFVSNLSWIGSIWLEEIIYIYLLVFFGIYRLYKKHNFDIVTIFPLVFTLATIFVGHRDISRYLSPVYPFVLLSYSKVLTNKTAKVFFLLLLPAIFLYAINFVIGNTTPVADWSPYL